MAGEQRPHHHVQPGDVRRREREQPRPRPTEACGRRGGRREDRGAGEHDLLRGTRGARGGDDRRTGILVGEPRLDGVDVTVDDTTQPQTHATNARARLLESGHALRLSLGRRRSSPHAARRDLARAGRYRRRGVRRRGGVVEGAPRPRGRARPSGRRELRQRLLRRHPRHRRRAGRSDAPRRLGYGVARRGEARGVPGVRGGGRRRARARRDDRLVAGARRRAVRAGRVVLHRRLEALRIPGSGRGHGLRVLRAGRGGRHDVRPDAGVAGRRAGTPRSASARSPARSWSPTTSATSPPTAAPARSPSPSGSETGARGSSTCC